MVNLNSSDNDFYINRMVEDKLMQSIESPTITMIAGARQVGKSTLMARVQEYVEEKYSIKNSSKSLEITNNIFSYTLDDIQLRGALRKDIRYIEKDVNLALGENLHTTNRKVFIFIDEVQKFPSLFDWIKQVFDKNSKNVKFVITGSSAVGLTKSVGETLAGRVEYIHVYPIVYPELTKSRLDLQHKWFERFVNSITTKKVNASVAVQENNTTVTSLTDNILAQVNQQSEDNIDIKEVEKKLQEILSGIYTTARVSDRDLTAVVLESMFYGGLPRLYNVKLEERIKLLRNYISVYLEKEIGFIARNLDLELFGLSLQSFAEQNGGPLNINQVSKEVGIARPSLYKYLDLLENTFLIKRIYPYGGGQFKDTSKSLVLYYLDSGILNSLLFTNSIAEMLKPDNFKRNIGTFVLINLLVQLNSFDNPPDIHYWQDYEGHKVDFILEFDDFTFAFIVEKPKDIRKLRATKSKFTEIAEGKNVIFIYPVFNPQNIDITYKMNPSEDGKSIDLELPLQLWL